MSGLWIAMKYESPSGNVQLASEAASGLLYLRLFSCLMDVICSCVKLSRHDPQPRFMDTIMVHAAIGSRRRGQVARASEWHSTS